MAETKDTTHIEREYTIPLRHRWNIVPTYKRANKAVKSIREFLVRHMKIRDKDLDKIKIDKRLNEVIWSRGIKHPPAKIKIKAIKDGDIVRVEAVEMPDRIKFKKIREEKLKEAGKEKANKKKIEQKAETAQETKESTEKENEKKEDKAATIEAGKEIEKADAKKAKHETKVKSPKEEKNTRTGYNQQSRGH
jgi:large subunit ribosomal protein L31e